MLIFARVRYSIPICHIFFSWLSKNRIFSSTVYLFPRTRLKRLSPRPDVPTALFAAKNRIDVFPAANKALLSDCKILPLLKVWDWVYRRYMYSHNMDYSWVLPILWVTKPRSLIGTGLLLLRDLFIRKRNQDKNINFSWNGNENGKELMDWIPELTIHSDLQA